MQREILENVGPTGSVEMTGCFWVGVHLSGFTVLSAEPRTDATARSVLPGVLQVNARPHGLCWTREIFVVASGPFFVVGHFRCLFIGLLYSITTALQSIFPWEESCHDTS